MSSSAFVSTPLTALPSVASSSTSFCIRAFSFASARTTTCHPLTLRAQASNNASPVVSINDVLNSVAEDSAAAMAVSGSSPDASPFAAKGSLKTPPLAATPSAPWDPNEPVPMELATASSINQLKIAEQSLAFKRDENDTGSIEYQVGRLSIKINLLTEHLKENRRDNSCIRGLKQMVEDRKRLLRYLKRKDEARFDALLARLPEIRYREYGRIGAQYN